MVSIWDQFEYTEGTTNKQKRKITKHSDHSLTNLNDPYDNY